MVKQSGVIGGCWAPVSVSGRPADTAGSRARRLTRSGSWCHLAHWSRCAARTCSGIFRCPRRRRALAPWWPQMVVGSSRSARQTAVARRGGAVGPCGRQIRCSHRATERDRGDGGCCGAGWTGRCEDGVGAVDDRSDGAQYRGSRVVGRCLWSRAAPSSAGAPPWARAGPDPVSVRPRRAPPVALTRAIAFCVVAVARRRAYAMARWGGVR
jgi:hypothetical protein